MTCREKILSEDYADLLLRFTLSQNLLPEYQSDSCYVRVEGDISVVYLSLAEAGEIQISTLTYQSIPQIFGLMMDGMQPGQPAGRQEFDQLSLINSGILAVQNAPLSLTGRGVVIGFMDTGIDYTLPVFRRSDGSTRILAIWDQTIQDGTPPAGYLYGTEYTREQIDRS